jgi:hypothetical protein
MANPTTSTSPPATYFFIASERFESAYRIVEVDYDWTLHRWVPVLRCLRLILESHLKHTTPTDHNPKNQNDPSLSDRWILHPGLWKVIVAYDL